MTNLQVLKRIQHLFHTNNSLNLTHKLITKY